MSTTIQFKEDRNSLVATITGRIVTAIEMLDFESKLEVQQETTGVWTAFQEDLNDSLKQYQVYIHFQVEYFKGHNDVIFEVKMLLNPMIDRESKEPIESEKILGTILKSLFIHFGWSGWNIPKLIGDEYNNRQFKDLIVFQNRL